MYDDRKNMSESDLRRPDPVSTIITIDLVRFLETLRTHTRRWVLLEFNCGKRQKRRPTDRIMITKRTISCRLVNGCAINAVRIVQMMSAMSRYRRDCLCFIRFL